MLKRLIFLLGLTLVVIVAHAQKLPGIQTTSLWAPVSIKIDGKPSEWGNEYQALNKATGVFYTIANDNENIYLIVHAKQKRVIQKIIDVGITFIINNNKKEPTKGIEFTYPILDAPHAILIISNARANEDLPGTFVNRRPDTVVMPTAKQVDSLRSVANSLLAESAKTIKVKGVKQIADSLLSVYNEERILVAARFDSNNEYTYELCIPIKYLDLSVQSANQFMYSVKLSSRWVEPKQGMHVRYYYPVRGAGPVPADPDLDATTDFSGEYTFAKKP